MSGWTGRRFSYSPPSPTDLYEDDEPVEKIRAIWEQAETEGRVKTTASPAEVAIERVRALHRETPAGGYCISCKSWGWPCPTIRALDGGDT